MKFHIETIKNFLCSLLLFFLPLHTIYILWVEKLGALGEDSGMIWQYGVIGLYFFDILSGLLLIFLLYSFVVRIYRKEFSIKKLFIDKINIILFLLGIVVVFSLFVAQQKSVALMYAMRFFEGYVIFYGIRVSTLTVARCAWIIMVAGALQGILALGQFFNQDIPALTLLGIAHHSPQDLGTSVVAYGDYRWLRAYGSFPHPNFLASFLAVSLISAWYLIRTVYKKWQSWIVLVCTLSISSGFFLAFSRNAWIGIILVIVVWLLIMFVRKNNREKEIVMVKKIRPQTMFIFIVLCIWVFLGIQFSQILATRIGVGGWQRLEQKSLIERQTSFRESFTFIKEFPLGVGLGNDTVAKARKDHKSNIKKFVFAYQPVHSSYLLIARELGIQGFFAFIGFLFFLTWLLLRKTQKGLLLTFENQRLVGICFMTFLLWNLTLDHFFISHASGIISLWAILGLVYLTAKTTE